MEILLKYFADFTPVQQARFEQLAALYSEWNAQINVISRKDIDSLYERHVLHSLAIAAVFDWPAGTRVLDIGTGGGFPGIPLAIFFPEVEFLLADSIRKKLQVTDGVASALELANVKTYWGRVEDIPQKNGFDFAVSRAVAPLGDLWRWAKPLIRKGRSGEHANGLACLKGGDLHHEISESGCRPTLWSVEELFPEPFFHEKFLVYVPR